MTHLGLTASLDGRSRLLCDLYEVPLAPPSSVCSPPSPLAFSIDPRFLYSSSAPRRDNAEALPFTPTAACSICPIAAKENRKDAQSEAAGLGSHGTDVHVPTSPYTDLCSYGSPSAFLLSTELHLDHLASTLELGFYPVALSPARPFLSPESSSAPIPAFLNSTNPDPGAKGEKPRGRKKVTEEERQRPSGMPVNIYRQNKSAAGCFHKLENLYKREAAVVQASLNVPPPPLLQTLDPEPGDKIHQLLEVHRKYAREASLSEEFFKGWPVDAINQRRTRGIVAVIPTESPETEVVKYEMTPRARFAPKTKLHKDDPAHRKFEGPGLQIYYNSSLEVSVAYNRPVSDKWVIEYVPRSNSKEGCNVWAVIAAHEWRIFSIGKPQLKSDIVCVL